MATSMLRAKGMGASAHRMVSNADFPARGLGCEKLEFAIRQAMLPSELQHWRSVDCFIHEQFMEVSARSSAGAAGFDPEGRDGMIHCGVTLQRLKLTLKRHGCFGRIDLFPDLDQPNLAARVHLGCGGTRSDFEQQLSKAMAVEERLQRLQTPVSNAVLNWLGREAALDRSWLEIARCEGSRQRLMELVRAPVRIHATDFQVRSETVTRSTNGRSKLTRFAGGILPERFARWRKPTLAIKVHATSTSASATFDSSQFLAPEGTYAVLKTKTDDKRGWLAAGQTLGRLLLHAQSLGLPCNPFINPLRQPELRAELRTAIGHKGFMQVIVCFGTARTELLAKATEPYPTMSSRQFA